MIGTLLKQGAEEEKRAAGAAAEEEGVLAGAPAISSVRYEGTTVTMSITTRQSVRDDFDEIAQRLGVTRHQVMVYAMRHFLAHFNEGTSGIEKFVVVPKTPSNRIVIGES